MPRMEAIFEELLSIENTYFPRCLRPEDVIGEPMLIVFSDGSKEAFGACAYIRWKVGKDRFWVRLISAKNRIAPARVISIPRMELCGAVIGVRLRQLIEEEQSVEFASIMHIIDSTIVYVKVQDESHPYKTFVANSVGEVQCKSKKDEWWLVASKDNVADTTTRIMSPTDLGIDTVCQNGLDYLQRDVYFLANL